MSDGRAVTIVWLSYEETCRRAHNTPSESGRRLDENLMNEFGAKLVQLNPLSKAPGPACAFVLTADKQENIPAATLFCKGLAYIDKAFSGSGIIDKVESVPETAPELSPARPGADRRNPAPWLRN